MFSSFDDHYKIEKSKNRALAYLLLRVCSLTMFKKRIKPKKKWTKT